MSGAENAANSKAMFGDYEIIETVGQGGMGIVYRAHDASLGRVVALKVLKDDLRASKQICARFQREAEAFASLNHPNIVHIYSVGSVGNIPFLSMEFIEGSPLSAIMKKEKRIPWKRAFHISEQIAKALGCAHDAHIIHRDIKPGNIMVDENDRAFVTDFGIAKVLTAETQLTIAGSRLGTPQYMSPERCLDREVTGSSDIYSLGVMLFQMITGRLPYEASTPVELIKKIVTDAPSRVSQFRTDIPEDVERLVAFTIEKKPRNRPRSAQELAELLRRVRAGEPLAEGESGIVESLESLRGSIATPLSSDTPLPGPGGRALRLLREFAGRWTGLPEGVRIGTIGAVIVAMAALAGFRVADVLNRGYAVDTVRSMNRGMESWNRSPVVADFFEESAGVFLARVNMPSYRVTDTVFLEGGNVALQIEGVQGSSSALCVVDLSGRNAWMSISPKTGIGSERAFHFAGSAGSFGAAGSFPNGYFYARPVQEPGGALEPGLFLSSSGTEPQLLFKASYLAGVGGIGVPAAIGLAVASPSGNALVMSVSSEEGSDSWSLVKYSPREAAVLDIAGPPIAWINVIRGDPSIRYLRQGADGTFQLWSVDVADPAVRELLYEGRGTLGRSAMGASGRYLVTVHDAASSSTLRLIDLEDASDPVDLGAGTSAAWHPSGEFIVITASDRKGNYQLWAIRAREPYDRAQLTFLAEGTAGTCLVSPDGLWATATAPDAPVAVFVDVSEEVLDALEF